MGISANLQHLASKIPSCFDLVISTFREISFALSKPIQCCHFQSLWLFDVRLLHQQFIIGFVCSLNSKTPLWNCLIRSAKDSSSSKLPYWGQCADTSGTGCKFNLWCNTFLWFNIILHNATQHIAQALIDYLHLSINLVITNARIFWFSSKFIRDNAGWNNICILWYKFVKSVLSYS